MKSYLPTSWGPATVIAVALILLVAVGGLIQVITDDISYQAWVDTLTSPGMGILAGGLAIGRGIAWGGQGTSLGSTGK